MVGQRNPNTTGFMNIPKRALHYKDSSEKYNYQTSSRSKRQKTNHSRRHQNTKMGFTERFRQVRTTAGTKVSGFQKFLFSMSTASRALIEVSGTASPTSKESRGSYMKKKSYEHRLILGLENHIHKNGVVKTFVSGLVIIATSYCWICNENIIRNQYRRYIMAFTRCLKIINNFVWINMFESWNEESLKKTLDALYALSMKQFSPGHVTAASLFSCYDRALEGSLVSRSTLRRELQHVVDHDPTSTSFTDFASLILEAALQNKLSPYLVGVNTIVVERFYFSDRISEVKRLRCSYENKIEDIVKEKAECDTKNKALIRTLMTQLQQAQAKNALQNRKLKIADEEMKQKQAQIKTLQGLNVMKGKMIESLQNAQKNAPFVKSSSYKIKREYH